MTGKLNWCRIGIATYVLLYIAALALAVIGTQGLFGTQPDGLTAIWLIFIGLPWSIPVSLVTMVGFPLIVGQIAVVLAPLINLWFLYRMCQRA